MAFAQAKVTGLEDLQRKLKVLPRRVQNKSIRSAVNMGARIVSKDAKRLARRGKTKLLAKSIGVKGKTTKRGYYTVIGSRRGFAVADTDGNKIYDPTRIVHLVEKGTKPHLVKRKSRGLLGMLQRRKPISHPGAKPYPFIEPSLKNNLGQVQGTIRNKLASEIAKEAAAA